ncbi:MAG TPA: GNAT family N-acyltransferase [Stellaceae bacterium]|nr:GNAT family N-acyltransferase [Stellaceae bacterium]
MIEAAPSFLSDTAPGAVDLRSGRLQVRLARTVADIDAAQALRYRVFYEEMGANPSPEMARLHRDFDDYDGVCDHLLVLDHKLPEEQRVIGTYRLIRRHVAERYGRFYSASEYDVSLIEEFPGQVLELGRSCVAAASRNGPTMQLLWRGLATYVRHHDIALMFGCASLPGIDPDALALPLSYLYYHHLAPPGLRPMARPELYVDMRRIEAHAIDPARALAELPPLIKGYMRLGGFVGDGAVIDRQFNTIDVCVVVKSDLVTDRYARHYDRPAREPALA